MPTYIEPLDFKKILLDILIGSPTILAFVAIVAISFLAAKFNMSNRNFMWIIVLCSLILAGYMGEAIYIIIVVVLGFMIFKIFGRMLTV